MLNLSDPSLLVSSAYINGVWVDAGLRNSGPESGRRPSRS